MVPVIDRLVRLYADQLSTGEMAIPATQFVRDNVTAGLPGLYSWWVDEEGLEVLEAVLDCPIGNLIYAGQAGATSTRSKKASAATLGSRIVGQHLRGTAYGSTFRKTLSALLLDPLSLVVERSDHLTRESNARVSDWLSTHLSVIAVPHSDRGTLKPIEHAVLRIVDPPLNLEGMTASPVRERVARARRAIAHPDVEGHQPSE